MTKSLLISIEDDENDIKFYKRALKINRSEVESIFICSIEEIEKFLRSSQDQKLEPGLILLDWNLAGYSGAELLRHIRATPSIANVPVVILSSSDHPDDIKSAYKYGASAFVQKPTSLEELDSLFSSMLHLNQLP